MEFPREILAAVMETALRPFAGRAPLASLIPLGVALGIAMLWVVRRVSNQAAIRDAKRRIQAHLYELRLFVDEPRLIWRAQAGLLKQNARYLSLMLLPAVVLAAPFLVLFAYLDGFYSARPLEPGRPAVVTVRLEEPLRLDGPAPVLEAPEGFVVESPPVRVMDRREISWRIRPVREAAGELRVNIAGEPAAKSVRAGEGPAWLAKRRVSSAADLLRYPAEARLDSRVIEYIEVDYRPAAVEWLGLRLHWVWWLLIVSMATAFVLRNKLKVTF